MKWGKVGNFGEFIRRVGKIGEVYQDKAMTLVNLTGVTCIKKVKDC